MREFLDGLLGRLQQTFDPVKLGDTAARVLESAVIAVVVFLAYYVLWRLLDPVLKGISRRTKLDPTTAAFTATALKYSVLIVGMIHGLDAAGVNTTGIVTSLGIAGLTVGFAARDALSNLISGILIFWDRPFVIGDLVEIGGHYGRVDTITLRSTRVITVDGRMLAVPNTEVINSTVASYTNFPHLRIDVQVTVGLRENIDGLREVLLDIVRSDSLYLSEPPPTVVVKSLNDYNVELELRAWIGDERLHIGKRFELRERVFERLTELGVEMPLETIQLAPVHVTST